MSFVYPAGLWSLLGVLLLILIYLVRKKYDAQTVSSTYLWRLSERFLRQSRTVQQLKKALLFALQLACVALSGLLIAQPMILLPGADTHYVAILDGSGSMRIADGSGRTRFERALEAIASDTSDLPWGSSVTVILAGDGASVAADHLSAGDVRRALEGVQCGWGAGDLEGALALCQSMFDGGMGSEAVLYTDREYAKTENVSVVNMRAADEWNVAVSSLAAEGSIYGTAFVSEVTSWGRDANVTFELYLDGEKLDGENVSLSVNGRPQESSVVLCPDGEAASVSLLGKQVYDYADARVVATADDGLAADNEYRLHSRAEKTTRALLVGEKTYFLKSALSVFSDVMLETAAAPEETELSGFDLYVFDGCQPDALPSDGAVWLVNPPRAPQGTNLVFGEALRGAAISAVRSFGDDALYELTQNLMLKSASVIRFREVVSNGRFTPVLLCGAYPVLLAGRMENGEALLVMPFDLQDTNLPLLADYVILVNNMLSYCVPPMLPAQDFECGQIVYPRTLAKCEKLFAQYPDMSIRTLDHTAPDAGMRLAAPGSYTLMQELSDGTERILDFYAHLPVGEGRIAQETEDETLCVSIRIQEGTQATRRLEGRYFHPLRLLAAALLLLLTMEWVVYHREKY